MKLPMLGEDCFVLTISKFVLSLSERLGEVFFSLSAESILGTLSENEIARHTWRLVLSGVIVISSHRTP